MWCLAGSREAQQSQAVQREQQPLQEAQSLRVRQRWQQRDIEPTETRWSPRKTSQRMLSVLPLAERLSLVSLTLEDLLGLELVPLVVEQHRFHTSCGPQKQANRKTTRCCGLESAWASVALPTHSPRPSAPSKPFVLAPPLSRKHQPVSSSVRSNSPRHHHARQNQGLKCGSGPCRRETSSTAVRIQPSGTTSWFPR